MTTPASVAPGSVSRDGATSPNLVGAAAAPGKPSSPRERDGENIASKGSKAAPIHRVRIEYPGYALHGRTGILTGAVEDEFLGTLFCIEVEGCAVALTRPHVHLVSEATP